MYKTVPTVVFSCIARSQSTGLISDLFQPLHPNCFASVRGVFVARVVQYLATQQVIGGVVNVCPLLDPSTMSVPSI
jgi:hypothetical protein